MRAAAGHCERYPDAAPLPRAPLAPRAGHGLVRGHPAARQGLHRPVAGAWPARGNRGRGERAFTVCCVLCGGRGRVKDPGERECGWGDHKEGRRQGNACIYVGLWALRLACGAGQALAASLCLGSSTGLRSAWSNTLLQCCAQGKTALDCVGSIVATSTAASVTLLYRQVSRRVASSAGACVITVDSTGAAAMGLRRRVRTCCIQLPITVPRASPPPQAHWPLPRRMLGTSVRRLMFNRAMTGMMAPYYTASAGKQLAARASAPLKKLFWRSVEVRGGSAFGRLKNVTRVAAKRKQH